MGQKVHPTGIRLGISKDHTSKWYATSADFPGLLGNDMKVRAFLKKKLAQASVSRIQIERPAKKANITIHTARPDQMMKVRRNIARVKTVLNQKAKAGNA